MKKVLFAVLFVFAMSTVSTSAFADGHGSKCSKGSYAGKQCKVKMLKEEMSLYWAYRDVLKMSDDQLMQIGAIKTTAMKEMIQISADAKVAKVDVKSALWAPQIDAEKVMPLIDAKYAAKAKLAKTMVQAWADAQAVLTDEQRAQMKEIKTDRYIKQSGILDAGCSGGSCPYAAKHGS